MRKRKLVFRVRKRSFCLHLTSSIAKLNYKIMKSRLKYSIFTITMVFQTTPLRHFRVENVITSVKMANHTITPTAGGDSNIVLSNILHHLNVKKYLFNFSFKEQDVIIIYYYRIYPLNLPMFSDHLAVPYKSIDSVTHCPTMQFFYS